MSRARMAADYTATDWKVVDYQIYRLDPRILDPEANAPLLLRGPQPANLAAGLYMVFIGAAQTFGRFCEQPFPTLLGRRLGLSVLNLGRGGAGPSFFSQDNDTLLEYVNGARVAVIQVMSGRSTSNSQFESRGLGHYRRRSDGAQMGCDEAFRALLAEHPVGYVKALVAETRENWIEEYRELLRRIRVPKILFWFSTRHPAYQERYGDVNGLYGAFPQLVSAWMIDRIRPYGDAYVECVSSKGLPHLLANRLTGEAVTIEDPWGGTWSTNWYYPSPEMHEAAAKALEQACWSLANVTPGPA